MALAEGEAYSETNVPAGPSVGSHSGDDGYKCGYLQKKTKSGQWQRRWFETNGVFLTYYKNKKMSKLLAAVNLPQVGDIAVMEPDAENDDTVDGGCFSIQLNSREYILKAADHEEALAWVKVLTKLKAESGAGAPAPSSDGAAPAADTKAATEPSKMQHASGSAGDVQKASRGLGCCPSPA
mmetsp:Transcript_11776/g.27279  ORF Transcript_11776/g.27279 Transcript_11776/m.27279 type:complete len:181 (-) Transcript_11776:307-849(-)